jgi:hypothetical protein
MHSVLKFFVDDEAGRKAGPNGRGFSLRSRAFSASRAAAGTNLSATFSAIESALPLSIEVQQTRVEA